MSEYVNPERALQLLEDAYGRWAHDPTDANRREVDDIAGDLAIIRSDIDEALSAFDTTRGPSRSANPDTPGRPPDEYPDHEMTWYRDDPPDPNPDTPGRPQSEQWWTINGQTIIDALQRAHDGDDPNIVYMELYASSESIDYG